MRVRSRRLPMTAIVGDFIVFLAFPFLGAATHGMAAAGPDTFVRTVVPLTTAWLVVGLVTKAFTPAVVRSVPRTLRLIPAAWLVAGALGVVLRSLFFDRPLDLTFALITIGVIGVLLALWRLALATVIR